jgi:nucleotide-binding universal stress UspA family protein
MKFSKILVPVKGHAVDDQVVRLACITARVYKAKVSVLHVIEMRRSLPLETENAPEIQHAEEILDRASQVAREVGVQVQTELLQARAVAPVLMDEAIERGTDLIIMGVPYRQPLEEFYIGSTIRYILKNAACPVWLCREQASPSPGDQKKK